MTELAISAALARLDSAVARLERNTATRASDREDIATAYARLDERHGLLRRRIQETIARLDTLIEPGGRRLMAQVTLTVGGRSYDLGCRDGEEPHLRALAALVDARVADAGRSVGGNEARQLLMAGLMLADELDDLRAGAPDPAQAALAKGLDALAARVEALAARLENGEQAS